MVGAQAFTNSMNSINHDFMHMEHKKLFGLYSDYNSFIHEQALDVINNFCWRRDDWVTEAYDNEWYPDVVVEVG